jgi:hypothetical protein
MNELRHVPPLLIILCHMPRDPHNFVLTALSRLPISQVFSGASLMYSTRETSQDTQVKLYSARYSSCRFVSEPLPASRRPRRSCRRAGEEFRGRSQSARGCSAEARSRRAGQKLSRWRSYNRCPQALLANQVRSPAFVSCGVEGKALR